MPPIAYAVTYVCQAVPGTQESGLTLKVRSRFQTGGIAIPAGTSGNLSESLVEPGFEVAVT
jgi:hypothetical protein